MKYSPEGTNKKKKDSSVVNLSRSYRKAAPYINSVYTLFASLVVVGLIGWYVDKLFLTKPVFTILGLILGMGVGFYSFFKAIAELDKKNENIF